MNEIWKAVIDYEGIYDVSCLGRVRSLDRLNARGHRLKGRILKQSLSSSGYLVVGLYAGFVSTKKTRSVHQLVAEVFIGPKPQGQVVCHGPRGQFVNTRENLYYGTLSENQFDTIRDGTYTGIPVIRGDGVEFRSANEAARITGCRQSNITNCCKGRDKTCGGHTWRYKDDYAVS